MKKNCKRMFVLFLLILFQLFVRLYQVKVPSDIAFAIIEIQEYYGISSPQIKEIVLSSEEKNYILVKEIIEKNIYIKNINQRVVSHDSPSTAYVIRFVASNGNYKKSQLVYEIYDDGSIRVDGMRVQSLFYSNKNKFYALEKIIEKIT